MASNLPNDPERDLNNAPIHAPQTPLGSSDSIAAQIGEGAKNVIVGKHINQTVIEGNTIGTFINNLFSGDSEDARKLRNRQVMLKLVYDIWVKGVLEHSLYNQLLIDLDMEQRPEAVERPWGMVLETPAQASRLLPSGTKMVTIFAELNQSLLILGEPGSGKSTMLLELARDLLAQAAQNPALPMPVLFNLSSWAEKHQPLRQWLVDELREKYQIPKALAQAWVAQDELLLLLDGLDEVKQVYREECIKALNEFQQSGKTLVPLALCSRTAEYAALTSKLKLNGAIVLHPLTLQQIDTFLLRAGDKLSAVSHLLPQDAELRELAQSPLTFSILCLTYQDKAVADIEWVDGGGTRLQQLFDAYIVRMFQRPGKLTVDRYPRAQTLHWLAWLAARMVQYVQTEFLIERLQPDWLHLPMQIPVHLIMFMWGPLYALVVALIVALSSGLHSRLSDDLLVALRIGLNVGLIDWLSGGLGRIRSSELSKRLQSSLYVGLFWGLLIMLVAVMGGGLNEGPLVILSDGLIIGLLGALIAGFKPVKLVDRISGTWQHLRSNLLFGPLFGLRVGLSVGVLAILNRLLTGGMPDFRLNIWLLTALSIGLIGGLFFGLIFESATNLDETNMIVTQTPNQGIVSVGKFSLAIGVLVGLFMRLSGWPLVGLLVGLVSGLISGGDIFVKHLILRFVLYLRRYAPLNYARFLDYCADRIFLRKVGGGYIFVHRLLMEHFASLTEEDIQRLTNNISK